MMEATFATDSFFHMRAHFSEMCAAIALSLILFAGCESQPGLQVSQDERAAEIADYYSDAVRQGASVVLFQWNEQPGLACQFLPTRRPTLTDYPAPCSEQVCSWQYEDLSNWRVDVLRAWNGILPSGGGLDVFVRPIVVSGVESQFGADTIPDNRVFGIIGPFGPPLTDTGISTCDLASAPYVDQLTPFQGKSFGRDEPGNTLVARLDEALAIFQAIESPDAGTLQPGFTDLCRLTSSVFRELDGLGGCSCPVEERSISFDGGVYPFRDGGC